MNKIVSKQEFKKKIRPQLKSENKTITGWIVENVKIYIGDEENKDD